MYSRIRRRRPAPPGAPCAGWTQPYAGKETLSRPACRRIATSSKMAGGAGSPPRAAKSILTRARRSPASWCLCRSDRREDRWNLGLRAHASRRVLPHRHRGRRREFDIRIAHVDLYWKAGASGVRNVGQRMKHQHARRLPSLWQQGANHTDAHRQASQHASAGSSCTDRRARCVMTVQPISRISGKPSSRVVAVRVSRERRTCATFNFK